MDDHERFTMQLRDYFAAKAMAALIVWDTDCTMKTHQIAVAAYAQADAMLAEREK